MRSTRDRRFEKLLTTSLRRLSAIARSYARGGDDKDLLQEILLQIWRSLERFEDLSYRQIAEISGLTENHVGVKLHRLKRAFLERYVK